MIGRLIDRMRNLHNGVLGINARNLACVYPLNPRCHFPRADNKLLCKQLLAKRQIAHPKTLAVYNQYRDLLCLEADIENLDGFAVKPERGCGGRGILVVKRDADGLLRSGGEGVGSAELRAHIYRILTGCFSLEKVSDSAFIEQLIIPDDTFKDVSFGGLPDFRIIMYQHIPVMAMARVPTAESGGLANLHQGALGLGVDLQTGITTQAVYRNRHVAYAPNTNKPLAGIQIPHWEHILDMATQSSHLFGLGYLGVDIVIDRCQGPMVIEVNARSGLNIQLANAAGLKASIPWEAAL
ncbi:MAG: alpha-L-glutamate ligase-like protein [Planctomycetota bacterium]|nr:MAG: alpha-L-glutamate ligase-like protein [Planctomycetota bacterium]